ncbi:MAG: FkbM family methyltransferase, partial [Planctomycetota bacterium]
MRLSDLSDYVALRRMVSNPWETIRFRTRKSRADRRLVVRMLDGPPLHVRGGANDYHIFHRIFLRDEYRLEGHTGWECVIDIGGSVGLFATRAAAIAKRVITYEPVTGNFEQLQLNCSGRKDIEAVLAAVSGTSGRLRIYRPVAEGFTGRHSAYRDLAGLMTDDYDEVDAITLDELFLRHQVTRCDLLKIDCEGAEYEILHAASDETLEHIDRIHAEYHNVSPDDPRTRIAHF